MPAATYGGQAVVEGVMMRGRRHMAVACRAPSGEIVVHAEPVTGGVYGTGWAKLPFLRGTIMIWDTLSLGMRALMFAANVAASAESGSARTILTPRFSSAGAAASSAALVAEGLLATTTMTGPAFAAVAISSGQGLVGGTRTSRSEVGSRETGAMTVSIS